MPIHWTIVSIETNVWDLRREPADGSRDERRDRRRERAVGWRSGLCRSSHAESRRHRHERGQRLRLHLAHHL